MRKLSLILLLFAAITAYTQNWAPINTTEKFCYSSDENLQIIDNVLWVDTIIQINDTTIYHFNKIARPLEDQEFEYIYNEPQFLLDQVIVSENGVWEFVDTSFTDLDFFSSFKILPNAHLYDSWEFSDNMTAAIANESVDVILGEADSVKTIVLSDATAITLSKNHGIIDWRNQYELVGIEGRDLGIQVPDFDDMYAFLSPGDVVCVDAYSWDAGSGPVELFVKLRYDIESVNRYEDSILVEAIVRTDKHYIYWGDDAQDEYSKEHQTILFKRSKETDAYPNELVWQHISDYFAWGSGLTIYKLDEFKWGGVKKTQIIHEYDYPYHNLFTECSGDYDFELCESYGEKVLKEHSARFGFLEYSNIDFEHGGDRELVGVIDDGDTIGTIYPIDMFVRTHQLTSNSNWLVYPNPAKDFITIQTPIKQNQTTYKIFNLNGLLLKEGVINQEESSISVNELPTGMYFIELIINGEKSTKKWIKN
jgi:hypothetical protein